MFKNIYHNKQVLSTGRTGFKGSWLALWLSKMGAHITGFLLLEEPGTYRFQVTNNDGVRVHLGGARIHDDPRTGPARTSDPIPVEVTEPGFYDLEIWYFEKRGTATLELLWSAPGGNSFAEIPTSAMKHP